ncbi:MAG: hypothetical protein IT204_04705 [Fimbriimonadaceae bacterium]|nr:hypothetical protein [Fimbriimonadaceae bacterium]
MKRYLASPAARRAAWLTLVAFVGGLGLPCAQGQASAQTVARTAYLVPLTGDGVPDGVVQYVNKELDLGLRRFRDDPRVKSPIELVQLSLRSPLIKAAIDQGELTEAEVAAPPTDKDGAVAFARKLGLTTVLQGTVDSWELSNENGTGKVGVTITEWYVPSQPDLPATASRTVSKSATLTAKTDADKRLLEQNVAQRAAQTVIASLLDTPELAPVEVTPEVPAAAGKKKGGGSPLWIALGVAAGIAAIFLIASVGSSKSGGAGGLTVNNVRAVAETDSVRVSWDPTAAAIGYNVYRRSAGSQTVRSRSRQTTSGFELLVNPETNTTPTQVGSNRTSFIDTTATAGVIYEYAVAAISADNAVGAPSTPATTARAGSNIGAAPTLAASSGNGFIQLRWTATSGISYFNDSAGPSAQFVDGFIIFRRANGTPNTGRNSPDELVRVGRIENYVDRTVQNGVSYGYVVQPYTIVNVNGLLAGFDSNAVSVAGSAGAAPQAPTNVAAQQIDTLGRVRITWDPNPEASIDFYEVLQRRDRSSALRPATGSAPWVRGLGPATGRGTVARSDPRASRQEDLTGFQIVGTSPSAVTNFTVGPLPQGAYVFRVRAVSSTGQRGPTTATSQLAVNPAPAPPAAVRAVGLDRMVRITWQSPGGDVQSYRIYRSQSPIDATMVNTTTAPGISRVGEVAATTLSLDDTNLTNNRAFYYAVSAVSSGGVEGDFGKGTATDTGAIGIPHATPAAMTFDVARATISANGVSTTQATVTVRDGSNSPTAGVQVDLTTDAGKFVNLPANSQQLDTAVRQVRAMTDLNGQVLIDLQSSVVTIAGSQLDVNLQARAPELPDAVELQSKTVSFVASLPAAVQLTVGSSTLTADGASTTDLTARVVDDLGQPVPDGSFSVNFELGTTNGQIRAAGNVQSNPFVSVNPGTGKVVVWSRVVGGVAAAIYKAGDDSRSPQNAIVLKATAANFQTPPQDFLTQSSQKVTSQTVVTLNPGQAARIDFGTDQVTIPRGTSPAPLTVVVRDFKGNPLRAGTVVNFVATPDQVVTIPGTGTTDALGRITFQITAGNTAAGTVIQATIPGTQVQSQLVVTVQ